MNSKKIFVDNLKYLINRKNVSRSMFAQKVGVHYSTVVDWLTGRQYPSADTMDRIAKYFKVDRSALIQPRKTTSSEILSYNLYKLLHRRGITRPKVADDLNLSYNTVVNWFNGRAYPGIHNMDRLARYFNVSKAKLIEAPTNIDLFNILKYKNASWRGHPLDQDDYQMFKLWFKNKYSLH